MTFDPKVMEKIGAKSKIQVWRRKNAINFGISATNAWPQRLTIKFVPDLDL